jgi:hypothetical protein
MVLCGLAPARAEACPKDRAHCFEIVTHVVHKGDTPVVEAAWVDAQIAHANRLFEPVDVGFFRQGNFKTLAASYASTNTRSQRDSIGAPWKPGAIHVFIVEHLANVDDPGEINGVHWRNRARRSERWILLSSIAWDLTLAHELGHFFGLPHSAYPVSIMNKSSRAVPKPQDRVFHKREVARMKARNKRMLADRVLTSRRPVLP